MNIFNKWNTLKQVISNQNRQTFVKERDVVFIRLGKNIGYEQNGVGDSFLRPVVVVKKFNNCLFWGVPLTTKNKSSHYYFSLGVIRNRQNWAILSQGRCFDTKRVKHKMTFINEEIFMDLKKAIARSLSL